MLWLPMLTGWAAPRTCNHVSCGEAAQGCMISTQGFHQATATVVPVCLPGEGRSTIERGGFDACSLVWWPREERLPCNGFSGGFWDMEGGSCFGLSLAMRPGPGSTASSSGLVLQPPRASPGGCRHFAPGTERSWLLELAHGQEALSGCVCQLTSLTSCCASNL